MGIKGAYYLRILKGFDFNKDGVPDLVIHSKADDSVKIKDKSGKDVEIGGTIVESRPMLADTTEKDAYIPFSQDQCAAKQMPIQRALNTWRFEVGQTPFRAARGAKPFYLLDSVRVGGETKTIDAFRVQLTWQKGKLLAKAAEAVFADCSTAPLQLLKKVDQR